MRSVLAVLKAFAAALHCFLVVAARKSHVLLVVALVYALLALVYGCRHHQHSIKTTMRSRLSALAYGRRQKHARGIFTSKEQKFVC